MRLISHLVAHALGQVIGESGERVVGAIEHHWTDHSQALPKALARANDRAWQALGVALAGDGLLDQIKLFFASADDKGIRDQVRRFLQQGAFGYEGVPDQFRRACLTELHQARKAGTLSAEGLPGPEVAKQAAGLVRHADGQGLIDGACQAVAKVAEGLAPLYPNLADLLQRRQTGAPPLLVSAFAYFFRREVEMNAALARGLTFDSLRRLAAKQEAAFADIGQALDTLGGQFDRLLGQALEKLERIEAVATETRDAATATHGAVLDLRAELQGLGQLHLTNSAEMRTLMQQVLERLNRAGMQTSEIKPQHSLSIRSEDERRAVKQLLGRFRQLPAAEQQQVPALLNGLGKLQVGAGDFAGAEQTFQEVAAEVGDPAAKAEARYNTYRAALEERKWDVALTAIRQAAELDRPRFAPFSVQRYEPRRILGAGGFGTAFLCFDRYLKAEVVVKALHADDLGRSLEAVFGEAQALRLLRHPVIVEVLDCNYADPAREARPYIVMDYFPGPSLEALVSERGPLPLPDLLAISRQIAEAIQAAHSKGVLHRDLKPDNVLVRQQGQHWQVKVIDFGLALRRQAVETGGAVASREETILGHSVAGTVRYAPPEQLGHLLDQDGRRVPVGPYSDVYAFGKLCCYALFKTTEPRSRHLGTLPAELRDLLEGCLEQELEHRHKDFGPILAVLEVLGSERTARQQRERDQPQQKDQATPLQRPQAAPDRLRVTPLFDAIQLTPLFQDAGQERGLTDDAEEREEKGVQVDQVTTNALGMQFAWCPPGTFLMGSPPGEEGRRDDERQHRVTLTQGFYLGVHQVTQAQWQTVMGTDPSSFQGADRPVERVSWEDCQAFCQKLGQRDGKRYRLPTEAEWEYACRAGTTTPFCVGLTINTDQANFDGSGAGGQGAPGVYRDETVPVGSFPANTWGLCDMHGNVWEWCQDRYGPYPEGDVTDPKGSDNGSACVLRGGGWCSMARYCRSACRLRSEAANRNDCPGCRVVMCQD